MNQIIRLAKSSLLIVLLSVAMSACVKERPQTSGNGNEATVTFSLQVPNIGGNNSRSLSVADESNISNINVLLFDASGYFFAQAGSNITSVNATKKTFKVQLPVGTFDIVVIANGQASLAAHSFTQGDSKASVLNSLELSLPAGTKWTSNAIPMWGESDGVTINSSTTLVNQNDIAMTRMISKVEVVLDDAAAGTNNGNFAITSLYLYNYNTAGKLVPDLVSGWDPVNKEATAPHLADVPGMQLGPLQYTPADDPTGTRFTLSSVTNTIYTFEAIAGSSSSPLQNTCIVVGGSYQGSGADTRFYRLDFVSKNNQALSYDALLRNHNYIFHINSVSGPGSPTPEDAFDGGPTDMVVNLTIQAADWSKQDIPTSVDASYLNVSDINIVVNTNNRYTLFYNTDFPGAVTMSGATGSGLLINPVNGKQAFTVTGALTGTFQAAVMAGNVGRTITVTVLDPYVKQAGSAAPRIYIVNPGDPNNATPMLTQDRGNYGALFQFGGCIAWDNINAGAALYHPYLPSYPATSFTTTASFWTTGMTETYCDQASAATQVSALKSGYGDPCRLVGYSAQTVRAMINAGTLPDNKTWRLPTDSENVSFSTDNNRGSFGETTPIPGHYFPDATSTSNFLTASGWRSGSIRQWRDLRGFYWSSKSPCHLEITPQTIFTSNTTPDKTYAFSIRCVKNSYTLTFDANGGYSSVQYLENIPSNQGVTLPTPTLNGSTFLGWKNTAGITYPAGSYTVTQNMKFIAQWGPYSPTSNGGWAGSNIYWNGTQLTFDDTSTPADANQLKQGVLFMWGSLMAIAHNANFTGSGRVLYSPTGAAPNVITNIPRTTPPASGSSTAQAYLYTNHDPTTNKGDICRYITEMGWAPGANDNPRKQWRMPTAAEFGAAGSYAFNGPASGANPTLANGQGLMSPTRSYNYQNARFPLSGNINITNGGTLANVGAIGSYWSSSYFSSSAAYNLREESGVNPQVTPQFNSGLDYLFTVRCIRLN